ncbi:glycosyltransferase family 92 protein [uncultured Muribaculum sp.]|uniref:glycosyltransferase family 92 protein n=1 Tax=uncultured Muribaculum sp. TaxID=1918613 RepID=UPI002711E92A|nr:glycosyltransferase family 92 protein [uncultured Muribaculum sp.]
MKIQHYQLNNEPIPKPISEFVKYKLPLLLYAPVSYTLSLIHRLRSTKHEFRHKVSLCLIFKDEEPYLKEWIDYHILIGVDHFYLYNNNSSDRFMEVLSPYIAQGKVTLIDFPEKYAQVKAYRHCYETFHTETEWLGYIDADEYINLIKYDSLKDLLDKYKNFPSVYLNWRMFGTSGHLKENPDEFTIERYTQAWANLSSTGKGFINNNFPSHSVSVHFHTSRLFSFPILGVLANKSPYRSTHFVSSLGVDKVAYINHHWSRSLEFYRFKNFIKGDSASAQNKKAKKEEGRFEKHELRNICKDFSIQRWLIFLK